MIIALDFGGTHLAAALLKRGEKEWLVRERIDMEENTQESQYETMLELAHKLQAEVDIAPQAVGVSFGGPVDAANGVVQQSFHAAGWSNFPLVTRLQAEFGVPVAMDNDANVAALGEHRYGGGQDLQHLLFVTVSTGVGAGWLIEGKIFRGGQGLAGEIGHTLVQPDGLPCACGQRGCLEAEASGPAIAHRGRLFLARRKRQGQQLRKLCDNDAQTITGVMVSESAAAGDRLSQTVLRISAEQLGRGLSNAITLMNPERVFLGGGVTGAGEVWWKAVRETTRNLTPDYITVDISMTELEDDAPLWGAAALAEDALS